MTQVKEAKSILEFPDVTLCGGDSSDSFLRNTTGHDVMHMVLLTIVRASKQNRTSDVIQTLFRMEALYSNLAPDMRYIAGPSMDELIVHCTFQGRPCEQFGEFSLFTHFHLGNCYTYRFNPRNGSKALSGPSNGLSLILRFGHTLNVMYDSSDSMVSVNGLKIVIHERGTVPLVMSNGIDIQPGYSTNIGMKMKMYNRLGQPYGDCSERETVNDIQNNTFFMDEQLCEENFVAKEIFKQCGCHSAKFFHSKLFGDITANCFYMNDSNMDQLVTRINCELDILRNSELSNTEYCYWPCQETDYDLAISQTLWPNEVMISNFVEKYIHPLPCSSHVMHHYMFLHKSYSSELPRDVNCKNIFENNSNTFNYPDMVAAFLQFSKGNDGGLDFMDGAMYVPYIKPSPWNKTLEDEITDWIKNHFYRLNVYFTTPVAVQSQQVVSFSMTDLFSGLGGAVGLWCGASAISGVEIILFISELVQMVICFFMPKAKVASDKKVVKVSSCNENVDKKEKQTKRTDL